MEDTCCDVCYEEYDAKKAIPKVIQCGHSLCLVCLKNLMQNESLKCPRCVQNFVKKSPNDFPTNFSLLSLSENFRKLHNKQIIISSDVKTLKLRITETKNQLSKLMKTNKGYLEFLDLSLFSLQEIETANNSEFNMNTSIRAIKEIKNNLYTVESNILPIQSDLSVTLNFKDCANPDTYLRQIYTLVQNDESVCSVHLVGGKVKYGRVSSWGNMLLFHSLCLPRLKETADSTIQFQSLKSCVCETFRPFLEIRSNANGIRQMVLIEMLNSPLSPQFIKLCTGELGMSYKGATFWKGHDKDTHALSLMKVNSYIRNGEFKEKGEVDYCIVDSDSPDVWFPYDTTVIEGSSDGSFGMYHSDRKYGYKNPVGKVEKPLNLKTLISYEGVSHLEIVDCGIAFRL